MYRQAIVLLAILLAGCAGSDAPPTDVAGSATATVPAASSSAPAGSAAGKERTPSDVVAAFGARMQRVSTTASPEVASKAIRSEYAGLVDPQLLETWAQNPSEAPGRAVSSPWPERIEIASSTQRGEEANVEGSVVERTSSGVAGKVPVRVQLRHEGDAWMITAFDKQAVEEASGENAGSAVAVVREYYRAIEARDFRRAWALWGENGAPGQTFDEFANGYADTVSVRVETGTPSRVEPAAGSRYVEVPVTIVATDRTGHTERFEGSYTLRRSVIEGGEANWRLERGTIRRVTQ